MGYMTNLRDSKQGREGLVIVLQHALRYKTSTTLLVLFGVAAALLQVLFPYLLSQIIDSLSQENFLFLGILDFNTLEILAILFAAYIVNVLITFASGRISRKLMLQISNEYLVDTAANVLQYPISFFKTQKMGRVYEVLGRANSSLQNLIGFQIPYFGVELLTIVFSIIVLFLFSVNLALFVFGGVILYVAAMVYVIPRLGVIVEKSNKINNSASEDYYEALGNAIEIKKNNTIKKEIAEIQRNYLRKVFTIDLREQYLWVNTDVLRNSIRVLALVGSLLFGIVSVQKGVMSLGEVAAISVYVNSIFRPLAQLSDMWLYLQGGVIKVKEAHDLFTKPIEDELQKDKQKPLIQGVVRFEDVSFKYNNADGNVIRGVNFVAQPGEVVALVGKSGSGKSTISELLGGFYFPQKGKVLIDGVATRHIDLQHLRSHIAYVSQEVTLFNDTVAKNIAYGAGRRVTQQEIENAAKQAHCHEFIQDFKKGYKQVVGERGIKLSVGQKQRIAIARAILRDPTILVLDEPTSALDSESEKYITQSLSQLMKGRTTFVIAHRLSTVRNADQILVMQKGKIIERGTHKELLGLQKGQYKYMYDMHVGLN